MAEAQVTQEERPAHLLYQKAVFYLYHGKNAEKEGIAAHHLMSGVLYTAFAFEAMMFQYAKAYDPRVNDRLSREKLHKLVRIETGLDPHYFSRDPYKTVKQCLEARDNIVHGKPITRTVPMPIPEGAEGVDRYEHMMTRPLEIEELCTVERLEAYMTAIVQVQEDLKAVAESPGMKGKRTLSGCKYMMNIMPLHTSGMRTTTAQ